jgi:serine/threonine-protein kinase
VRSVRRPDARYPPETVIAQTPAAGRPARPGTVVTLTLATRPRPVAVPMLLGLLPDEAASRLRGLGLEVVLRVAAESSPGDPGRAGRVWKQHPPAGTRRLEGREVRLWVNPA